jgi:transitional endoplasmic reticulum ATPase
LPDEAARVKILTAQLARRLWTPFPLDRFASRTPGWSAAKLAGLANKAASLAAAENRPIAERDLEQALGESGEQDRPLIRPVEWGNLVLSPAVEQDLRSLIRLMDAREAERLKVPAPTGLLLVGPSGTGKTSIAHLIATQTRRSFYAVAPADVPTPEKLAEVFARAREHSPSIILIDEIDGLLPRGGNGYYMGQHQVQFVDQALTLMSQLEPANQVFLIGTTNRPDRTDPRVLRGGRFTDRLEIGMPDDEGYQRLFKKCLGSIPLAPDLKTKELVNRLRGIAPADLEAVVGTMPPELLARARQAGSEEYHTGAEASQPSSTDTKRTLLDLFRPLRGLDVEFTRKSLCRPPGGFVSGLFRNTSRSASLTNHCRLLAIFANDVKMKS